MKGVYSAESAKFILTRTSSLPDSNNDSGSSSHSDWKKPLMESYGKAETPRNVRKSLRFNGGVPQRAKRMIPRPLRAKRLGKVKTVCDVATQVSDSEEKRASLTPTSPKRRTRKLKTKAKRSANLFSPFTYHISDSEEDGDDRPVVVTPTTYAYHSMHLGDSEESLEHSTGEKKKPLGRSGPEYLHYVVSKLPTMYIPYKKSAEHVGTSMTPPYEAMRHEKSSDDSKSDEKRQTRSVVRTMRGDALRKINARAQSLSPTLSKR